MTRSTRASPMSLSMGMGRCKRGLVCNFLLPHTMTPEISQTVACDLAHVTGEQYTTKARVEQAHSKSSEFKGTAAE